MHPLEEVMGLAVLPLDLTQIKHALSSNLLSFSNIFLHHKQSVEVRLSEHNRKSKNKKNFLGQYHK